MATPGLTAARDVDEARRIHVEGGLEALPLLARFAGSIVDVGSGGGSPGLVLAATLPDRAFVLLEANGRKASFLERQARVFPNVRVVRERAEEHRLDAYGAAVARALAPPPVAVEWCLPLVAVGGAAIIYAGPRADLAAAAAASRRVGGGEPWREGGLLVVPKVAPTPPGFPRRPGTARRRPLA